MPKRILLFCAVLLVLAGVATLIPGPRQHSVLAPQVHATGSPACTGFCPPPPQVTLCAGGGTNPANGRFIGITSGQFNPGSREYIFFPAHPGCQLVLTNLYGSVITTSTSSTLQATTAGIYATSDSLCSPASLGTPLFQSRIGVNVYHPSDKILPPSGINWVGNQNTAYCIAYYGTFSNWWEDISVSYGFE
jgi:hypothetical protein